MAYRIAIAVLLLSALSFACAPDPCTHGEVCSSLAFTPIWGPKPMPTVLTIAETPDSETLWLPSFPLGSSGFCHYFHAIAGTPPYKWVLGKDASFSDVWIDGGGALHGRPGAPGNYTLVVKVTDAVGVVAKATFWVQVCAWGEYCTGFGN